MKTRRWVRVEFGTGGAVTVNYCVGLGDTFGRCSLIPIRNGGAFLRDSYVSLGISKKDSLTTYVDPEVDGSVLNSLMWKRAKAALLEGGSDL